MSPKDKKCKLIDRLIDAPWLETVVSMPCNFGFSWGPFVVDHADYLQVNAVTVYSCLHCVLMLLQMEKEKRKRAASRAPKQRINKKGRSEKPAVTQGRRSKFTAMSAQTMTSEDDDGDTYQQRRFVAFVSNTAADNEAYHL